MSVKNKKIVLLSAALDARFLWLLSTVVAVFVTVNRPYVRI